MPSLPHRQARTPGAARPADDIVGAGPAAFVIPGTVHARTQPWSLQ